MIDALPFDHYALRVPDREAALPSLTLLGYEVVDSFTLILKDGSTAQSYALAKEGNPDIFVSSGPEGSLIQDWVDDRGGMGAVHHTAYHVDDVAKTMEAWKAEGVKFKTEEPIKCSCPNQLTQVFTEEDPATGQIYELINRNGHPGFCKENVTRLMNSSKS
jgi:catechol 2,3-dioxygenase-like lactoylglutathione lyase family enzyme